jgi:uncharacterized membrane protein
MTENNSKVDRLHEKLESLVQQQVRFDNEINELRSEINDLKSLLSKEEVEEVKKDQSELPVTEMDLIPNKEVNLEEAVYPIGQSHPGETFKEQSDYSDFQNDTTSELKSDLEKFIGENLINKIGIAVTVIGVAIGAKYSIEHQLISPVMRIILGYLVGLTLVGFGLKLKKNYEKYSAVLVSGAIAIMYFITYAAFTFYGLIPQAFAFVLMVFFTAFTVIAALNYNQQVIAHIGLVGAYAVPFLLSEGSSNVGILFSYMAIINIGILTIAFKKYWKSLYYSSFLLTWIIFLSWYFTGYNSADHFGLALFFISVFFVTFYAILLAYKLLQKETFDTGDILMLISNSFIFYGLGYSIFDKDSSAKNLLGLFTLLNALVNFVVGLIINRNKLGDRNLFYLVTGLVLVFITLSIPVQLDGSWVTLLWAFEASLLFWIGRTKNAQLYEILAYVLIILAFISIVHDWYIFYNNYNPQFPETRVAAFFNISFLSSLLFVAAFSFMNILNRKPGYLSSVSYPESLKPLINFCIPAILLIVLYNTFRLEISTYWNQLYKDSAIEINRAVKNLPSVYRNNDLKYFKIVWIINYSLLFFSVLSFVNIRKIRSAFLGVINIVLNAFFVVVFLTVGLYTLSNLRDSYLHQTMSQFYSHSGFNIGIRYISFAFAGLTLLSCYRYINQDFIKLKYPDFFVKFDLLLYTSLLWIISSELINILDIRQYTELYRLGISILWGVYALLLVIIGIWKNKKHLRIGAIALFAVTLLKLFFYDISHLKTIPKTIIFVSLGVLLLVISFLYNKFRNRISEANTSFP